MGTHGSNVRAVGISSCTATSYAPQHRSLPSVLPRPVESSAISGLSLHVQNNHDGHNTVPVEKLCTARLVTVSQLFSLPSIAGFPTSLIVKPSNGPVDRRRKRTIGHHSLMLSIQSPIDIGVVAPQFLGFEQTQDDLRHSKVGDDYENDAMCSNDCFFDDVDGLRQRGQWISLHHAQR